MLKAATGEITGEKTMLKKLLMAGLAVLLAGCVPIPQLWPKFSKYLSGCPAGHEVMLPGQSAEGFVSDDLPDYIDIVGVSSDLNDETLTATFRLRGIPERMEFNRKGVLDGRVEYMWVAAISIEGDPHLAFNRADYLLEASYAASRISENTPGIVREVKAALHGIVLKRLHDSDEEILQFAPLEENVDLVISHQDNTLTVVGRVPGITDKSTIEFSTNDNLLGRDYVQCQPG